MPLTDQMLAAHIAKFGPYAYHETHNTEKLAQEGLQPRSHGSAGGKGGGWGGSVRENHVYMRVPMGDPKYDEYIHKHCSIRIDLRNIDPERFDIDEDAAGVMGANIAYRKRWPEMVAVPYVHPDKPGGKFDFDVPEVVQFSMQELGTVAVRGSLGADCVHVNPDWVDLTPELASLQTDVDAEPELDAVIGSVQSHDEFKLL